MSPADGVNKPEENCTGSAARHMNRDVTLKAKRVMLGYICTFCQSFSPPSHAILSWFRTSWQQSTMQLLVHSSPRVGWGGENTMKGL